MKKIGLALGSGGARGLSHIGVLKVFEQEKVPISYLAGASMGAIVSACYAIDPNIARVEQKIKSVLSKYIPQAKISIFSDKQNNQKSFISGAKEFIKQGYLHYVEETQQSLFSLEKLKEPIYELIPDIDISQTKIPLCIVVTDLENALPVYLTCGSLRNAVLASSSIAGIFPPVRINGFLCNDGGYVGSTPVPAIKRMGAQLIIGIDVKGKVTKNANLEKAGETLARSKYISAILLNNLLLKEANVVISADVKNYKWTSFDKIDLLISKGESSAREKIKLIKELANESVLSTAVKKLLRLTN